MRSSRTFRTLALTAAAAMTVAAFAGPAAAGKKPKACPAYTPPEEAAEATTVKVTPKYKEDAPLEVKIEAPAGVPASTGHAYQNVVIRAPEGAGLFARYEFAEWEDYDMYLLDSAGEEVASVGGFNPAPYGPFDGTGNGGHSEMGAEQLDGFGVLNCDGYTFDLVTYLGEGGELTLKLWLGEAAAEEE